MTSKEDEKCGWLWKKGAARANWKMRFFTLQGSRLAYFARPAQMNKPLGVVDLVGASVKVDKEASVVRKSGRTNVFRVVPSVGNRTYLLSADTVEQRDSWVADLCRASGNPLPVLNTSRSGSSTTSPAVSPRSASHPLSASMCPPLLQGYLVKQGHVVKNWKQRWFTLRKNIISYFRSPFDEQRQRCLGVIPLHDCTVRRENVKGSRTQIWSIHHPKRKNFVLAAPLESVRVKWMTSIEAAASRMTDGKANGGSRSLSSPTLGKSGSSASSFVVSLGNVQMVGNLDVIDNAFAPEDTTNFRRRYCVVKDNVLYFLVDAKASHPREAVELEHCSVASPPEGGTLLFLRSGTSLVYTLQTKSPALRSLWMTVLGHGIEMARKGNHEARLVLGIADDARSAAEESIAADGDMMDELDRMTRGGQLDHVYKRVEDTNMSPKVRRFVSSDAVGLSTRRAVDASPIVTTSPTFTAKDDDERDGRLVADRTLSVSDYENPSPLIRCSILLDPRSTDWVEGKEPRPVDSMRLRSGVVADRDFLPPGQGEDRESVAAAAADDDDDEFYDLIRDDDGAVFLDEDTATADKDTLSDASTYDFFGDANDTSFGTMELDNLLENVLRDFDRDEEAGLMDEQRQSQEANPDDGPSRVEVPLMVVPSQSGEEDGKDEVGHMTNGPQLQSQPQQPQPQPDPDLMDQGPPADSDLIQSDEVEHDGAPGLDEGQQEQQQEVEDLDESEGDGGSLLDVSFDTVTHLDGIGDSAEVNSYVRPRHRVVLPPMQSSVQEQGSDDNVWSPSLNDGDAVEPPDADTEAASAANASQDFGVAVDSIVDDILVARDSLDEPNGAPLLTSNLLVQPGLGMLGQQLSPRTSRLSPKVKRRSAGAKKGSKRRPPVAPSHASPMAGRRVSHRSSSHRSSRSSGVSGVRMVHASNVTPAVRRRVYGARLLHCLQRLKAAHLAGKLTAAQYKERRLEAIRRSAVHVERLRASEEAAAEAARASSQPSPSPQEMRMRANDGVPEDVSDDDEGSIHGSSDDEDNDEAGASSEDWMAEVEALQLDNVYIVDDPAAALE